MGEQGQRPSQPKKIGDAVVAAEDIVDGAGESTGIVAVAAAVGGGGPRRKKARDDDGVDAGVLRDAVVAAADDDGDDDDVGISHRVAAVVGAAAKADGVVVAAAVDAGGATGVAAANHPRSAAVVDRVRATAMVVEVEVKPQRTNGAVGCRLPHHCRNSCYQRNHRSGAVAGGVARGAVVVAVAGDVTVVNGDGGEGEGDFRHHRLSCR